MIELRPQRDCNIVMLIVSLIHCCATNSKNHSKIGSVYIRRNLKATSPSFKQDWVRTAPRVKVISSWMIRVLLFLGLTIVFSCEEKLDPLTTYQQKIVNELNALTQPIAGSSPGLGQSDLLPLDFLADAKIVGLGEATHGTKEFFEMKHRIFRYMVEKFDFKAIGFEMDFAESIIFDDYIQGKRSDELKILMRTSMIFWIWNTEEVRSLLEWMKTYNQGKSEADRLHFYGFDCQFPRYNADFLVDRISKVDLVFASEARQKLALYQQLNSFAGDSSNYKIVLKSVNDIYSQIVSRKDDLISRGLSSWDYEIVKQLSRTIVQTHDVIYRVKLKDYKIWHRDLYMAENAQWISNLIGQDKKICLWAHNLHISGDIQNKRMGYYLASSLSDQYKKVGFVFTNGTFHPGPWAIETPPIANSINYILHQSKLPNFILDINSIPFKYDLYKYARLRQGLLSIGGTYNLVPKDNYRETSLHGSFDALIYFDRTNHSELF